MSSGNRLLKPISDAKIPLTGDKDTDANIMAFIKARESLMKRKGSYDWLNHVVAIFKSKHFVHDIFLFLMLLWMSVLFPNLNTTIFEYQTGYI